jgi:hypothetical protein
MVKKPYGKPTISNEPISGIIVVISERIRAPLLSTLFLLSITYFLITSNKIAMPKMIPSNWTIPIRMYAELTLPVIYTTDVNNSWNKGNVE